MANEFINHFFAGRIYQYYLDNKSDLTNGLIEDLGFLVPKKDGIDINVLKKLVKSLIGKDGIVVKSSALPRRSGWRISLSIVS